MQYFIMLFVRFYHCLLLGHWLMQCKRYGSEICYCSRQGKSNLQRGLADTTQYSVVLERGSAGYILVHMYRQCLLLAVITIVLAILIMHKFCNEYGAYYKPPVVIILKSSIITFLMSTRSCTITYVIVLKVLQILMILLLPVLILMK